MKYKFIIISVFVMLCANLYGQEENKEFKWMSFDEARAAFEKEQRPLIVNFYDSSLDSCKMMIDSVYNDNVTQSYLNKYFYAVNYDVNSKKDIVFFDGKTYGLGTDGKHTLKEKLIGPVDLPAILLFNKQAQGTAYNTYIDKHRMIGLLLYYAEEAYNTTEWDDFYKVYTETFPKERGRGFTIVKTSVKWLSMEEALEKHEKEPKPIFLDVYANWKNTCTVMLVSTYANDSVADILNNKFYPVRFEATTRDSMMLKGTLFTNPAKDKKEVKVHDFATTILASNKKGYRFPSLIFFDKKTAKPISFHQEFYSSTSIVPLLNYYASESYKSLNFEKYKAQEAAKKKPVKEQITKQKTEGKKSNIKKK